MTTIDLSKAGKLFDKRFLTIGPDISEMSKGQLRRLHRKIKRQQKTKVKEAWATLGWNHYNKHLKASGSITFSTEGNYNSDSVTLDMVKAIRGSTAGTLPDEFVLERYIDLSKLDLQWTKDKFHIDKLPELRLTLFLDNSEGALVYYDYGSRLHHSSDEGIDFITPEPTNASHSTDRDRLNYYFPIIPHKSVEAIEGDNGDFTHQMSEINEAARFVIKILTYKRGSGKSTKIVKDGIDILINHLEKKGKEEEISERYDLLVFNPAANDFESTKDGGQVDFDKKTLMLVHGTFANTRQSFGGLFAEVNGARDTFLQQLIQEGIFEQIIAFDHRYLFDDAFDNAENLKRLLGQNTFSRPISLMGTSRGGVVAYVLAKEGICPNFTVEKVLTVSAAFGVGYLLHAKNALGFLNNLKRMSQVTMPILAVVAQHSAEWFISQPGLQQIRLGSKPLSRVLAKDARHNAVTYLNIRTDWDKSIATGFKAPKVLLDWSIRIFLGKQHDWVVGYEHQHHHVQGRSLPAKHIAGVHTRILLKGNASPDPRSFIREYFR